MFGRVYKKNRRDLRGALDARLRPLCAPSTQIPTCGEVKMLSHHALSLSVRPSAGFVRARRWKLLREEHCYQPSHGAAVEMENRPREKLSTPSSHPRPAAKKLTKIFTDYKRKITHFLIYV